MKKFFAYFFGAAACLGAGAGIFIALNSVPANRTALPEGKSNAASSLTALLPLVGERLGAGMKSHGPEPAPVPKETKIIFMGDIMIGRSVAEKISQNGNEYPFAKIKDEVTAADYAIANLEGPVTKINGAPTNRMRFHFDPALAPVLTESGFDAFSLANNHGLDQGAKGEKDTETNLAAAGLGYFGSVDSDEGPILRFERQGIKFAAIGLHDVYRKIDPKAVGERIAALKEEGSYVIVYPHWGNEYEHEHNARQEELAHAFIDAGADLVIGSHPHVIQGVEIYEGKPIFYSLGNLIFDQYFSADTQEGLAVSMEFSDPSGPKTFRLMPYEIPASQPDFAVGEKMGKMLAEIASWSDPGLKEQIESGTIIL